MDVHAFRRNASSRSGSTKRLVRAAVLSGIAGVAFGNAFAAAAEPLHPMPAVTNPIQEVGYATPFNAWTGFCNRLPEECDVDVDQPERVALTRSIWEKINAVNRSVNAMILPVTDRDHWGVVDRWDYPDDGMGDCEDIQLLKRRYLVAAGLPQRALRMTVVADEHGDGHAVLTTLTDRGDFILDNKRNAVLPWRGTGYTYFMREGTKDRAWVALADRPAPLVTANR